MARLKLTLGSLKDFDAGKARVAFEEALQRVVRDCLDRPGDKSARKATLTAVIKPVQEQDGDVVDAEVHFQIKAETPPWQTRPRPVAVNKQGQLIFNDLAPDDPHQHTIDEVGKPHADD